MSQSTVIKKLAYISSLSDLDRIRVAVELVQYKLRPPVVTMLTGVNRRFCLDIWEELHETRPPKGQFPATCKHRIRGKFMDVSLLLGVYKQLGFSRQRSAINAKSLLRLYRIYNALTPSRREASVLNISDVYYILLDLRDGKVSGKICNSCHIIYLYDPHTQSLQKCPFCSNRRPKKIKKKRKIN